MPAAIPKTNIGSKVHRTGIKIDFNLFMLDVFRGEELGPGVALLLGLYANKASNSED